MYSVLLVIVFLTSECSMMIWDCWLRCLRRCLAACCVGVPGLGIALPGLALAILTPCFQEYLAFTSACCDAGCTWQRWLLDTF